MGGWETGAAVVTVVLCAALAVLLVALIALVCELRSMVRTLEGRAVGSNERLTVGVRSRVVVRLAKAFNAVLDAEQEARVRELHVKRAFQEDLAALSHDIRTPLAGAQGYMELWQLTQDPVQRGLYVASAQERLAAVRVLVDDLFEYTRVAEPPADAKEAMAPVALKPLVEQALLAQYPAFAQRGWEPRVVFCDEAFAAACDVSSLERIFANLVANALRHGVQAPVIEQHGTRLVFSNAVAAGPSIEVDRLFERFYRADAARSGAGSGLGLAIVARLCASEGIVPTASLDGAILNIALDFSGAFKVACN